MPDREAAGSADRTNRKYFMKFRNKQFTWREFVNYKENTGLQWIRNELAGRLA